MRWRWIALAVVAVLALGGLAWWASAAPAVRPEQVELELILRAPGRGENVLAQATDRWAVEVTVKDNGGLPLHQPDRWSHQVVLYTAGEYSDLWDFYQGLTFGSRGGSPVGDDLYHVIQTHDAAEKAATALQQQGVAATAEALERTWGFMYTGPGRTVRARFYLPAGPRPDPEQVALVYVHKERRLGRDLGWTKVVKAVVDERYADHGALDAHGVRPDQLRQRAYFPGGQALLWEEQPGRYSVGAVLKEADGTWQSTARTTTVQVADPAQFKHVADARPITDTLGDQPLWLMYGRARHPQAASVTLTLSDGNTLRAETRDGYWLAAHPGPIDKQGRIDLSFFNASGRPVDGGNLFLGPRCVVTQPSPKRGFIIVNTYAFCDADEDWDALPRPVPRQIPETRNPLEATLTNLLKGPTDAEQKNGFGTWFSAATEGMLRSARIYPEGRAVVDFADFSRIIPNASTSAGSRGLMLVLNHTVFQFPEVTSVEYHFNGDCQAFGDWLQVGNCLVVPRPPDGYQFRP